MIKRIISNNKKFIHVNSGNFMSLNKNSSTGKLSLSSISSAVSNSRGLETQRQQIPQNNNVIKYLNQSQFNRSLLDTTTILSSHRYRYYSSNTTAESNKGSTNDSNNNNSNKNEQKAKEEKKGLSKKSKFLIGTIALFAGSIAYFKFKYGEEFKVQYAKRIPFRVTSNLWGKFANIELPMAVRSTVYMTYSKLFGVKLDEVERPIDSYKSMADFFSRRLKVGSRYINQSADMVSPVDGTVIYFGRVNENTMEQVKGLTYSLKDFVGAEVMKGLEGKNLYHVALYLSPGDYHGIHSPVDWSIKERYHFPGYLFPVAKVAVDNIPGLFAMNERVVLSGQWKHGFFSLTPVGASNVGSIVMDFDRQLATNNQNDDHQKSTYYRKAYDSTIKSKRGDEVAFFKMGSTVILIFEVPKGQEFNFNLAPGKSVQYGEPIGNFKTK